MNTVMKSQLKNILFYSTDLELPNKDGFYLVRCKLWGEDDHILYYDEDGELFNTFAFFDADISEWTPDPRFISDNLVLSPYNLKEIYVVEWAKL
jgi:hypothetical protein